MIFISASGTSRTEMLLVSRPRCGGVSSVAAVAISRAPCRYATAPKRFPPVVVVDKPHFLATMPRGSHVAQTALVRLRRELDLPELSPAHRLDRLTAGVLLFTTRRELRGAYQTLFAKGLVRKTYLARAAVDPAVAFPTMVRSRIVKRRGQLQAVEESGEPNAETLVEDL